MKEEIRKFIKNLGVGDVGFSSVDDYISPNTPKIESFFPSAKSIVVMAYPELSTCESPDPLLAMNGRLDKDAVMRADSYRICSYLQNEWGAKVVSIPKSFPRGNVSAVSLRHAAIAAGLGCFGSHNLVVHPKFGTRVTFSAVVCDLELESDKKITEKLCTECGVCVKNCPAGALDESGKTDIRKCISVSQPYSAMNYFSYLEQMIDSAPEDRKSLKKDLMMYHQANSFITQYYCFNCMKLCPAGYSVHSSLYGASSSSIAGKRPMGS
ncbi:MAG TPA: 4Fe-4S double cluster binding domain-containing protein [Anaerovoracaceae bacterium]|nr:4Fe-4S double cluster binding domain-containing protein [Anaerovoracaceae bacterium]